MEQRKYQFKQILPGITLLYGFQEECCIYAVEGEDMVALIDTGMGTGNLRTALCTIAPRKECIVINTHCHFDHSAGNGQFEKVYMHPLCYPDQNETEHMPLPREVEYADLPHYDTQRIPVQEGDVFDLGGVTLEVIETPGHTPGCICLLDRTHRIVFGGDSIGSDHHDIWLLAGLPWVKFSTVSVECYLRSLQKLAARADEYDGFLGGHDDHILGKEYLDALICLSEEILAGTDRMEAFDLPSPPGMGNAKSWRLHSKTVPTAILYQDESIRDK